MIDGPEPAENRNLPIVLAPGIARFDILLDLVSSRLPILDSAPVDRLEYFRGIRTHLQAHGFRVYHTSVGWAHSLQERAAELAGQIDRVLAAERAERVHIISHSMGGLDARYMIANLAGMADKVAMLTTVGAPHHGTYLAELFLTIGGRALIQALMPYVHLDGFENLTPAAVEGFNEEALEAEAKNPVVYQTYASFVEERVRVFMPLQIGWTLLSQAEGPNDGLVSLPSQQWRSQLTAPDGTTKGVHRRMFPFQADHLNECGWWEPNDRDPRGSGASLLEQIAEFDRQVKQVYLEIAESAVRLVHEQA